MIFMKPTSNGEYEPWLLALATAEDERESRWTTLRIVPQSRSVSWMDQAAVPQLSPETLAQKTEFPNLQSQLSGCSVLMGNVSGVGQT